MKEPLDFFNDYKKFAWDKDSRSMINMYHEDVLIFDMWTRAYHSGLSEWSIVINDWLGSLKDENVKVTFDMINIQISDNLAFASAIIGYQAISPENVVLRSMKNRITIGFVRNGAVWKVSHQHTSAPIDSDLKAILDL